jgi:formate C-acetyltransferase
MESIAMNSRVNKLRQESLDAIPTITGERARLLTEFYQDDFSVTSYPVQRALAFEFILANKEIYINPKDLIVGERGPEPKATPTYPEICCHTLQDLEILDTREKIPYKVDNNTRQLYKTDIIPQWRGKTIREKYFQK